MGKKSTPKAPKLPNINEMINAQAKANRVDSHNVMGGNTFSRNPDGSWKQRQEYSPLAKALMQKQMSSLLSAPMSISSSRPQAIEQMYAQTAEKLGNNGALPIPQIQGGGNEQPDVNQLIQQSLPDTKQQTQQVTQPNIHNFPTFPSGGHGGRFQGRRVLP